MSYNGTHIIIDSFLQYVPFPDVQTKTYVKEAIALLKIVLSF